MFPSQPDMEKKLEKSLVQCSLLCHYISFSFPVHDVDRFD